VPCGGARLTFDDRFDDYLIELANHALVRTEHNRIDSAKANRFRSWHCPGSDLAALKASVRENSLMRLNGSISAVGWA